jgi:hypothetical protein
MDKILKDIEKLKALLQGNLTPQEDKEIYAELCELEEKLKNLEKLSISSYGSYFST